MTISTKKLLFWFGAKYALIVENRKITNLIGILYLTGFAGIFVRDIFHFPKALRLLTHIYINIAALC